MIFPERPTENGFQLFGQGMTQGAGIYDNLRQSQIEDERRRNVLQDMVEARTQKALQLKIEAAKEAREQKEAEAKSADDDHKRKVQEKLASTIKDGVSLGNYDANLVDGVPDPLMGMRPNAPQKEAFRPADENDVMGIAAEGMDPYQTAALYNKPVAAAASHGYKMDEIGAQGDNSQAVADIRARAMIRAAEMRARYGTRGGKSAPKDWKLTMNDSQDQLATIEQDLADLAAAKPKRSWDLQPWNVEMSRLTGQKKFYQSQIYKANQNGEPLPGEGTDTPEPGDTPDAPPDSTGAPDPAPRPKPGKPLTDKNTAAKYMAAAGGDKAKARQLAASDGWSF